MARKYVRFNYFRPVLVPAEEAIEEDLRELSEEDQELLFNVGDVWKMDNFLDFIFSKPDNYDFTYSLGDEYAELETDSYTYVNGSDYYSFQISKLRETNIPSKKRLGEIKQAILLNQDEYIGEFVSVLYDNNIETLMVQSNLYGVSTSQIEAYLTDLRFKYLDYHGIVEQIPSLVKLRPIIDNNKVNAALHSDYYRKIRIKSEDFFEDALVDDDLISEVRRTLDKVSGANIDLTISIGRAAKTASLDDEEIRKVINKFTQLPEGRKPNIELTLLENEEAEVETINFIEPRMSDRVSFEVRPRTTIGHDYLHQEMVGKYNERRPNIRRVIVN